MSARKSVTNEGFVPFRRSVNDRAHHWVWATKLKNSCIKTGAVCIWTCLKTAAVPPPRPDVHDMLKEEHPVVRMHSPGATQASGDEKTPQDESFIHQGSRVYRHNLGWDHSPVAQQGVGFADSPPVAIPGETRNSGEGGRHKNQRHVKGRPQVDLGSARTRQTETRVQNLFGKLKWLLPDRPSM